MRALHDYTDRPSPGRGAYIPDGYDSRPRHSTGGVTLTGATLTGANGASQLAGSGGTLSDTSPTQGRRQNLGFPTTTINILATTTIVSAPQVYFRPDRLFIASATGASFTVSNIEVGNKQQFVNSNPCPAAMFSELAVNADVEYDTCAPAVSISVQMTSVNTSASVASTPGMTGRSAY